MTKMDIGVLPIGWPTEISDAIVMERFLPSNSVAIGSGNILYIYTFSNNQLYFHSKMMLYGEISNLVEIYDSSKGSSNLLIVFSDGRYSVIGYQREFVTLQTGNIIGSQGVLCNAPFKIYKNEYHLIIQVNSTTLQYYEITTNCLISSPITISTPCARLFDFVVVTIASSTAKIAILIEDVKGERMMKTYTLDRKVNRFDEYDTIPTDKDAYRLISTNSQNIVILTTNKFIRHKISGNDTESSTIYTSHPIKQISMLSEITALFVDEDCNVYFAHLPGSGRQTLTGVGRANQSISLSALNEMTIFSFARSGPSYLISVVETNPPAVIFDEIHSSQESSNLLLQMDSKRGDFVSFAPDGTLSIIRKTVGVKTDATITMKGISKSWLFDPLTAIISFINCTRTITFNQDKSEIESVDKVKDLVMNESTIAFSRTANGFVQITPHSINFNGKIKNSPSVIVCAFCNDELTIICNAKGTATIYNSKTGEKLHSHQFENIPNLIAVNSSFIVAVFWTNETIVRISSSDNSVIEIPKVHATDIAACNGAFYTIDNSETILVLRDDSDNIEELHCEGVHTALNVVGPNSVFISGEHPAIIRDGCLFSLDCSAIVSLDSIDNTILYSDHSTLNIGELFAPRFKVSQRKKATHVYNAAKLPSGMFLLAYEHENTHYVALASNPLDTPEPGTGIQLNGRVMNICGICRNDRIIACLSVLSTIVVCESIDNLTLEKRCTQKLDSPAFQLFEFQGYVMACKAESIDLFTINIASLTDIKLHPRITHATLGNSTCVAINGDFIAVGDQLESVILYKFNRTKEPPFFEEVGRNCDIISVTAISFFGDVDNNEIFLSDDCGSIFSMSFSGTNNYISPEIAITRSISVVSPVTSFVTDFENRYIYATTESGMHYILAKLNRDERFSILMNAARKFLRSAGNLNPAVAKTVVRNGIIMPQNFVDLEIIEEISKLGKDDLAIIAEYANTSADQITEFCNLVLNEM